MPTSKTVSGNPFKAKWSAQGHMLCLGHWEISYRDIPLCLPDAIAEDHMNTQGIFSWLFPDDEEFMEGEPLDVWLLSNGNWLYELFSEEGIPFDEKHARWFYEAVNKQDWRCGSCGGCL